MRETNLILRLLLGAFGWEVYYETDSEIRLKRKGSQRHREVYL
jgi:hypothetical protein